MQPGKPTISKVTSPALSCIYPRARLYTALDHALEKPVVWIQGPAGSGKTTLVASYLASRRLPHIWYQLDEGDADCATLFYYLGLAADRTAPEHPTPLPLLTKEYRPSLAVFTRRYFEDLFGRLPSPCVIVFEDYQEVGAGSQFHEVIQHALEAIPQGVRVILISRDKPPSTLARLRARRRIGFISWEELRLDPEELEGVIGVHKVPPMNEKQAKLLLEQTGGWLAGVVLMLERCATDEIPEKFSPQGTVFDYFACEVFDRTDPAVQDFLLKTAFLQQFTPRMAHRLTGNAAAGAILAELSARNYFTEQYGETELAYRYHPLFKEFLLHRAQDLFPESTLARVRQQCAGILAENGHSDLAAELYLAARDWDGFCLLVERTAPPLITQGRSATLESWLAGVPREVLEERPWLLYWLGVCRFNDQVLTARALFESSLKQFRKGQQVAGIYLAWSGIANSYRHKMENWQELSHWIAVLDEIMGLYPAFPSPQVELRLSISMHTSLVLLQTEHQRIAHWEKRVLALLEQTPNTILHAQAVYAMLLHELWHGDYAKMRLLLDSVRTRLALREPPPLAALMVKSMEAFYYWVTAQVEPCWHAVGEGLATAQSSGIRFLSSRMTICKLQVSLLETDADWLEQVRTELANCQPQDNNLNLANYYFCCTMLALLENDVARAASCIEAAKTPALKIGSFFHECLWHLGKARVLFAQQKNLASQLEVDTALRLSRHIQSHNLEYLGLLTRAWFLLDLTDDQECLQLLRQAMALGREHDYEYSMWWDPRMVAPLCVKALEAGIEVDYVRQLVRRRRLVPDELPLQCATWPWPVQVYTLGEFGIAADGKPLKFSGKVQKKPIELLKALLALGGAEKREGQIADLLWPEADGDTAKNSFKSALHRLRKMIGQEDAIQLRKGKLVIDPRLLWSDVAAFEPLLVAAQLQGDAGDEDEAVRLTEQALALFRGPFLAGDGEVPWAAITRARLKNRFVLNTVALCNLYQKRGKRKKAVDCYLRGLEVNPHAEEIYQNLMQCHLANGLRAEAISTYRDCQLALAELGIAPSPRTKAIYTAAMDKNVKGEYINVKGE